jgi:uncharacterized protein YeaO (DUF488 family)
MPFRVKRVYNKPTPDDGFRVLVDRLWPRGLPKKDVQIDLWAKQIAPSSDLRKWFGHDSNRWDEFRDRYFEELRWDKSGLIGEFICKARKGRVTLLFAAKDLEYNNAVALREYLVRYMDDSGCIRNTVKRRSKNKEAKDVG